MNEKYLLGIDIGTSGTKTVLFTADGTALASYTGEYPLYQPVNGYAEQEPSDWWKAVCDGTRAVITKSGINPHEIAGVGLSGQMHGLVMLDSDGTVLRKSIIWCDQRTAAECDEITSRVGAERLMEITANPALTGFTASKILWVRNNEPDIYGKCRHILLPKDYIRYILTGEFATEVSDASGMQLLDIKNRCWSDEVLDKLEIERSLLGKMYESPEITGVISKIAEEKTGLAAGTPVVGGAGDNAAAAVGTGVVRDSAAFTTIGTSGVLFAHSSRFAVDKSGRFHTFCCAVPGEWHMMGVTQAAGLSLKWFKDNFCNEENILAQDSGEDVYALVDRMAETIPIGSDKLLYLPYLMGERTPHLDADARGVFFGLSARHTKSHLLRSIMEGISYSMRDCLEVFAENGISFENMTVCGGGGKSRFWRQMLSDVYACPCDTVLSGEGPALGAALLAGVGTGIYSTVHEACDCAVKHGPAQQPDAASHEEYMKFYAVFKDIYPALKPLYKELSHI